MSADNKWEAVNWSDLNLDDKIRLSLGSNGDLIHGRIVPARRVATTTNTAVFSYWKDRGYTIERAVPERTLPTVPGLYVEAGHYPAPGYVIYSLHDAGHWAHDGGGVKWHRTDDESDLPDDLVRLVPVAEVEELRQRIEKTRKHLIHNWDHGKTLPAIALLDGEA